MLVYLDFGSGHGMEAAKKRHSRGIWANKTPAFILLHELFLSYLRASLVLSFSFDFIRNMKTK
jgi:hypothetical protein